jgi:phytoene/squalene synthetase
MSSDIHDEELKELSDSVARSFSMTLKTVPVAQRRAVALTYLLARLADTLADCGNWTTADRLKHLERWERAIAELKVEHWKLENNVGSFSEKEATLVLHAEFLLKSFIALSESQRHSGQGVLKTLISAMKWDLKTFGELETVKYGIKDLATFDWYCFSIAGCVGGYWVKIFNLPQNLENLAVAYGKGLQRINILRDIAADYKNHRIYLPISDLQKHNINLDSPFWKQEGWRSFVDEYIRETRKLLMYGANFCDAMSYRPLRLRWASVLPLMIGWKTLDKLSRPHSWESPLKITRDEVKNLAMSSIFAVIFKRSFTKKFQGMMK